MKISRPSPAMVVACTALFVSLGGTSIAAVNFARNAGAVDGKSAVYSGAKLRQAAGKLVATERSGIHKGRLPGKFIADVPKAEPFNRATEVVDNAPGIAQPLAVIGGLGTLQTVCNDENGAAGKENAITSIVFNNTSGAQLNVARRVGVNDGATTVAENGTQTVIAIGGANTFTIHIEGGNHNAIIQGGARQQGTNSPAALCAVYGVVMDIQP
ncbi:MAG TPA: hypothetical protein VFZ00_30855 [Solirubrobacter sp.]|nr:hypothetical protein [Solirubrobacter sp.]